MAKSCIFCGKELGLLESRQLLCGNVKQTVCPQCCELMCGLSQEELGERALETGRAKDSPEIVDYLSRARESEARQEKARQSLRTGNKCLRCGGEMERYGKKTFHLGEEGLFGPVAQNGFRAAWLEADVQRCAQCGWAEFYLPEPPDVSGAPEVWKEYVTCPVCRGQHSPLIPCPWCAARKERQEPRSGPDSSKKPGSKPPWEK